ncbi:hypothetical protein [Paraburkholderia sp. MM6662-R1]|uniref:hypothetical protein n=1 Tax=Paraburkholderia sp. MM6662-R1 TaxID=2991066 RepID=UPI003D1BB7AB
MLEHPADFELFIKQTCHHPIPRLLGLFEKARQHEKTLDPTRLAPRKAPEPINGRKHAREALVPASLLTDRLQMVHLRHGSYKRIASCCSEQRTNALRLSPESRSDFQAKVLVIYRKNPANPRVAHAQLSLQPPAKKKMPAAHRPHHKRARPTSLLRRNNLPQPEVARASQFCPAEAAASAAIDVRQRYRGSDTARGSDRAARMRQGASDAQAFVSGRAHV